MKHIEDTRTLKLFQAGVWLVASDEPDGTLVPTDTDRWIATTTPVEIEQ